MTIPSRGDLHRHHHLPAHPYCYSTRRYSPGRCPAVPILNPVPAEEAGNRPGLDVVAGGKPGNAGEAEAAAAAAAKARL
jgi:hypothetical protein